MCTRYLRVRNFHGPYFRLNISSTTFKLIVHWSNLILVADAHSNPIFQCDYPEFNLSIFDSHAFLNQDKSSWLSLRLRGNGPFVIELNKRSNSSMKYVFKVLLNLYWYFWSIPLGISTITCSLISLSLGRAAKLSINYYIFLILIERPWWVYLNGRKNRSKSILSTNSFSPLGLTYFANFFILSRYTSRLMVPATTFWSRASISKPSCIWVYPRLPPRRLEV